MTTDYTKINPGVEYCVRFLVNIVFEQNKAAGWWTNLNTGESLEKNRDVPTLLMLCVSELAEGMEGHRKNKMDDHLPNRPMLEVELADCLIRIVDMAGGMGYDLAGAVSEKLAYNAQRADHKVETRQKDDGKKY